MGMIHYERNDLEPAIECFKRVLKASPQYAKSHNGLGNCYRDQGMLMEAFQSFKTAARLEPKDALYHHNLGLTAMDIGFHDMAVLELESAQALDGRNEDIQYDLGAAYYLSGDLERAARQYQTYLDRSPEALRAPEIKAKIKALHRRMAAGPQPYRATPAPAANDPF
jgi:tetratricopeptide (TPR) repeat protein